MKSCLRNVSFDEIEENYSKTFIVPFEMLNVNSSNGTVSEDDTKNNRIIFKSETKHRSEEPSNNFDSVTVKSKNCVNPGFGEYEVLKQESPSGINVMKLVKKDCKTIKVWECGMCKKEFKHQYTLLRHLPTHTDERKFKCPDCGKAFRQKSTLSQHQVIHSDARPYVCGFCKKTFNRVSTLKSHQVTHSEKKPHKCSVCGKGFHQKGNLRNHIFTHTEERPYKCEECGKGFNQKSNLMSHKHHSHGNITPFICNVCNKEFPKKYVLRAHEEYVHGIKYRGGMYVQGKNSSQNLRGITLDYFKHQSRRVNTNKKEIRVVRVLKREDTMSDLSCPEYSNTESIKNEFEHGDDEKSTNIIPSVIIDPIHSKAMMSAKRDGQTPIVLLKTAKGESVLVKVKDAENDKQMLVPATAKDLKSSGTITSFATFSSAFSNIRKMNAIQIKVPIVATMIQKLSANGQLSIEAEISSENISKNHKKITHLKENECFDLFKELSPTLNCSANDGMLHCDQIVSHTKEYPDSSNDTLENQKDGNISSVEDNDRTPINFTGFESNIQYNDAISVKNRLLQTDSKEECDEETQHSVCVQIVDGKNNEYHYDSINSSPSNDTYDPNLNAIGYELNESEEKLVINTSNNKITLIEYESENPLQHIVYAKPEEVLHNALDSVHCVIIDPVHLVLPE